MRNYPSLVTLHEKAKPTFLGFSCGPVLGTSGPGWELVLEMKNQFSDSVFCFRIRFRKKHAWFLLTMESLFRITQKESFL